MTSHEPSATPAASGSGTLPATSAGADLVLRNARIFTGELAQPHAEALAASNGRIMAIGQEADVARLIGPGTRVVDALGRRVIPGLNDSHIHLIRGGVNYLLELRWDGVPSLSMALQMLREQSERTPPGQWVRVVGGWSGIQFSERRLPTVSELNRAAPDTPVLVLHLYQSAILNRAAVAALGYTKETPDPPGGQIVRDHAGNPTGVLLAMPAPFILYGALGRLPVLDPDQQLSSTRHFFRELNRYGITSAIDAAGGSQQFPDNYAAVMQLAESGQLSVRIAYHLLPQTAGEELQELSRWVETMRIGDGNEWLRLNGAGEALTLSSVDFENFCEPQPELPEAALEQVEQAVSILVSNDWGFRLHASYGETIDRFLGIFDRLATDGLFPNGNRWFFDHAETVSPRSLERIAALGGGVSIQNRTMFQSQPFLDRHGPGIAGHSPPIRTMLDAGLTVAAGSDATRAASYNPWLSLSWLVTGRDIADRTFRTEPHLVDRATALRMYTRAGAELSGEADMKGTLSPGKFADFAILSADYFEVDESDISRIESVLTVVGGAVVWSSAEFEGLAPPLPAP
ncbi:MAG TPA: amidohydrolase, partial [Chloroflexota bacterium]|nr:amidohydrolase [Chloroflexota bacterium]